MIRTLTILLCIFIFPATSRSQSSYHFRHKEIKSGTKEHFMVPIFTGSDSTFIPITVFNGVKDGETLGITAGVHGYEYAPIMAAQKLINLIDLKQLKGVVILVQIASLESFLGRSPYKSPVDGKNLNRSFPGNKSGTNTEKIASYLTEEIISRANYFLDMHSGDAPEDLMSYSAFYSNDKFQDISQRGKKMASALGFDHVVMFNTNNKTYIKKENASLYCSAEAFKNGIPAIDIECGRLGLIEEKSIDKVANAVFNLLDYLSFIPERSKSTSINLPVIISNRVASTSNFNGIFYPFKKAGEEVKKGMRLGTIKNYFGEVLEHIYADSDGLLLVIMTTPAINKGEDVAIIGQLP